MAKEPSLDFLKSISKFKKNTLKKKSGKHNYKARIKLIDDLLITKRELESGRYAKTLSNNPPEELKKQITHRIERYKFFVNTLPSEIKIPKILFESFNSKTDIYKYFITFRRKNKICYNLVKNIEDIELETAKKIVNNFYNTDNFIQNNNMIIIKRIEVK